MTTAILIIIAIAIVLILVFSWRKSGNGQDAPLNETGENTFNGNKLDGFLIDEQGRKFRYVHRTREIARRTYLLGSLQGKYWGEIDPEKEDKFLFTKYFDFHIYESDVGNCELSRTAFEFSPDSEFPRERLPKSLPIILKMDGLEYSVNIHDPQLSNVKFNKKLHQTEGKEIFGTIEAEITGFLLDFLREDYLDIEYLIEDKPPPVYTEAELTKTLLPTGNVEFKNGYERKEYYYSDRIKTYWGSWKYKKQVKTTASEGCVSSGFGTIIAILGIIFLIILIPRIAILLPFLLIPLILRIIPEFLWTWIARSIGVIILLWFIFSIATALRDTSSTYIPKSPVVDNPQEKSPRYTPIVDNTNKSDPLIDTLIIHHRSWKDYNNRSYEGNIWVRTSDYRNASLYKNNFNIQDNTFEGYNELVYRLKEHDKSNLQGVMQLFDSIRIANKMTSKDFAEMIVSFVQDIPYAVVLPYACDPDLYADKFIKEYLSDKNSKCDGFEKFGLNSPVEFMATLSGDCDTRTLLIYTVLAHYNYDVTMLSSEYYGHSLIGINLPYEGVAYSYNGQRYILWETTAPNIQPGIISPEISNLNYWRISLKSK